MSTYIVIGAGILGATTAYQLAKAGETVTLIDRFDDGQATEAAAGIICPWLSQRRNKAWYRLAKGGAKYYPELIAELEADGETDTGYQKVGAISLHTDEKKLDQMEERAYTRREDAPEIGTITRLSPEETRAQFPALAEEYGAVHVSGGARVKGDALRTSLVRSVQKHGAKVIDGDATLAFEGNRVTGAKVNGETLHADETIVTTGAWAKPLFKPLGVDFKIEPQKAQIVHLNMPDTDTGAWPVVMPPTNKYILTFEAGRVVVGATHEDDLGFDGRITAGGVHEILDKVLAVAPGLADATIEETRVGFRPVAPGFLPVIGRLPEFEGIIAANGLGSSGLTAGPFLGSELARLARGKETTLDLNDYDISGAVEML
ncbi:NAD(P)/FAD-dependent oxidoreductase [Texcoconibacillus texcoconensis]|uniref:D-amino-acid dehydrogenase n=1 Tax=Texcoconibacillus texcoconensis TaxID=1095777 RepID=A0A840QR09_9BACI|nr:FAD-dependent oxidoreductase [Texcoconibacillus texcoconensis]MBB5173804.1 D-amino-acid dehydrogenase [Texcoconibacillus texcoconensis]